MDWDRTEGSRTRAFAPMLAFARIGGLFPIRIIQWFPASRRLRGCWVRGGLCISRLFLGLSDTRLDDFHFCPFTEFVDTVHHQCFVGCQPF